MRGPLDTGGALFPWIGAVLIVAGIGTLAYTTMPEIETRDERLADIPGWTAFEEIAASRARMSSKRRPLWTLVLGTSTARCAFAGQNNVKHIAAENGLSSMALTPLLKNGEKESARFLPVFDRLRDDLPDVIVIEEALLLWHHMREEEGQYGALRDHVIQTVRDWLTLDDENKWFPLPKKKAEQKQKDDMLATVRELRRPLGGPGPIPELQTEKELILLATRKNEWADCPAIPDEFRRLMFEAGKNNTKIVLLDISGSPKANTVIPARYKACAARIAHELESDFGVRRLVYPAPDDLSYYSDFTHMNTEGREKFLHWFLPRLKATVEDRRLP